MTKTTCYNTTVKVAPCPIVPVGDVEVLVTAAGRAVPYVGGIQPGPDRAIGLAHFGRETSKGFATCEHYGLFARDGDGPWRPIMSTVWQPIRADRLDKAKELLAAYGPKLAKLHAAEILHALSSNFLTEHGYDLGKHLVVPEPEPEPEPQEVAA